MADRAQVTSVEAIGAFRSEMVLFLTRARAVLEEASDEVQRTRSWVQNDQRQNWEKELRIRYRKLEEARVELFNSKLSKLNDSGALNLMAVQRGEQAHRAAEAKIGILKKWDRELENRTDPLVKQVNHLHGFLSVDMKRAIAHLDQMIQALEAYAQTGAPGFAAATIPTPATGAPPDPAGGNPPATS
jgi:hypothetical protein